MSVMESVVIMLLKAVLKREAYVIDMRVDYQQPMDTVDTLTGQRNYMQAGPPAQEVNIRLRVNPGVFAKVPKYGMPEDEYNDTRDELLQPRAPIRKKLMAGLAKDKP